MVLKKVAAAALIGLAATGVALAHDGEKRREVRLHGPHHLSIEHTAMHNIMAELLSAKTGKTVAEIRAAFEDTHPRDAMEKLGVSEEEFKPMFQQARTTLIDRASAAGLITSEQAQKMREAKVEMKFRREHRHRGDDGPGDDH